MTEAAKGINPEITPEEVKEEVKEATAEMVEKVPSLASSEMIGSVVRSYTLYTMAATLLLALAFLAIGLSGNPLSYAPVP
jgi:hypothetical protein